jgi:hypothetical protein
VAATKLVDELKGGLGVRHPPVSLSAVERPAKRLDLLPHGVGVAEDNQYMALVPVVESHLPSSKICAKSEFH